jgi:hypothetical protein
MEDKLEEGWDGFPDRYIHLDVRETEDGKYLTTEFPTPKIASVYIARKLADKYVQKLLATTSPTLGKPQPAVFSYPPAIRSHIYIIFSNKLLNYLIREKSKGRLDPVFIFSLITKFKKETCYLDTNP